MDQKFEIIRVPRSLAVLALAGAALVLLIPGDPKNAIFFGLSIFRLIMLAGFLGLAALSWIFAIWLRSRPLTTERLQQQLETILSKPIYQIMIGLSVSLIVFLSLLLLGQWLLTTDAYQKAILLRLLPVAVFASGVGWLVLSLGPLRKHRKRWAVVIILALLCTVGSRLLQEFLLATIERPYVRNAGLQLVSQLAAGMSAFALISLLSGRPRRTWLTWGWITILVLVLYLIQWQTYPLKYWPSLRNLALWGPCLVFGGTLLVLTIFDLWDRLYPVAQGRLRNGLQVASIVALLLLVTPFLRVSEQHSQVLNYTWDFVDQAAYMRIAKTASLQNFQTTGDHNRMPLYPFFLALFYRPGMSDTAFFELAKTVNILLSLVLLVLLFLFVRKYLSMLQTALFTAIAAFSLYIFKAAYIQSESVYYLLALVGFVLGVRLLIQPELKLAIATGVILGLAHLTKASILPGLLLLIAIFVLKEVLAAIQLAHSSEFDWPQWQPLLTRLGMLVAMLVCFLLVIFPYIRAMKARFGHYFYNVNTTFYIWYDSNVQAVAEEAKYHFAEHWPDQLSADELPSLSRYLREHSWEQILERVRFGLQSQVDNLLNQFSVTNYQLSYLIILIFVFLADLRRSLRLAGKYRYAVLYSVLYFVGYLAAFVWYSPISPERRFTYGLYLPFLFSVFIALRELGARLPAGQMKSSSLDTPRLVEAAHFIIFLTLPVNIYLVLVERMFFDRYGS